eukprot:TRINITY_DN26699_c0_g1_i1.p1 TRINITY_DN26699_c0_g1~~TRINITY_DN26699_c0_g1_i1.p1  ORF type:complete len:831 (-),score=407.19 TRINITY_DN26699_c0_g1_i1:535-3027(-)
MLKLSGYQLSDLAKSDQTDQAKKLLRYVGEAVRRIEEKHQAATRVEDVFTMDLVTLRARLKEFTQKLVLTDPLNSGTKAMEVYWRKAFHEPVSLARQLRGSSWARSEAGLVESHLMAGFGHYHHVMLNLAEQFGWENKFVLDFSSSSPYGWGFSVEKKKSSDEMEAGLGTWVEGAVHRCLVCLGDLARYQLELGLALAAQPARYYQLAVRLRPEGGVPYNQLAMLCGEENYGLDQLYYYMRCVTSKGGFEGGEANLKRLLDKRVAVFEEATEGEEGKNMVISLLQLVNVVVGEEQQEVVTLSCQQSLAHLNQLLDQPEQLSGPWLALTVSVVVMLLNKISKGDKANTVSVGLCQAWLLALLSHLALRVVGVVGREVWGEEFELPPLDLDEDTEIDKVETETIREIEQGKKRKNKLEELLRRRRAPQSGSEGEDSDESSDEIFESDTEDEEDLSDTCMLDSSSDEELDVVIEGDEESIMLPSLSELVKAVDNTQLLPTIRLCLAWLKDKPDVLGQTGPGSEQLWHNLARLFTLLALQEKESITASEEVTQVIREVTVELPLWEDWLLRGVFPDVDDKIVWEGKLEKREQGVARLVRIGEVRDWLCAHQDSKIAWSEGRGQAYVKREEQGVGKKNVMKHMAELWLRQEVKELEKEAGKEGGMVVVDGQALSTNLQMVKRTLGLKKFTVIVPAVAVQQLDGLKKTEKGARDAIRWLERELGRGNRWLRAQKEGEAMKVEGREYPRQRERKDWDRFQLLECLHYFISRGGVTLLTGDPDLLTGGEDGVGWLPDLVVENVEGFVPRFLGLEEKGGKERRGRGRPGEKSRGTDNTG